MAARSKRLPGHEEMCHVVQKLNKVAEHSDVLVIPPLATATTARREHLLQHLQLGQTQILRLQTPLGAVFSEKDMQHLMDLLENSRVWGLNMGEFQANDAAWVVFGKRLERTTVGFAWINELGKDIGATRETHEWLLGVGKFRNAGILRGSTSPLSRNRKKVPEWYGKRSPWYDSRNPATTTVLSKKFLFNPHNSVHYE